MMQRAIFDAVDVIEAKPDRSNQDLYGHNKGSEVLPVHVDRLLPLTIQLDLSATVAPD